MGSTLQPEDRNTCRWVAFTFTKRLKPRLYVLFGFQCLPSDLQDFGPRINRLTPNLTEHRQQRRHELRTIGVREVRKPSRALCALA